MGWAATAIGELIRIKSIDDSTIGSTNHEVLMLYLILIDTPQALLCLGTLWFAMSTGAFSPTGGNPHADQYDEVFDVAPNTGHLPETSEEITYPDQETEDDAATTESSDN